MTKKQILRCLCFLLIVCFMLVILCDLFEFENTQHQDSRFFSYRTYPKDTVDAVFIGTSGVDRYWISAKAYDEYGMTVFPLAPDAMPAWLYVNVMEEARTYQDPQLFILDIRAFTQLYDPQNGDVTDTMGVPARRILDAMDFFSPNRFRSALKTMKLIHSVDETAPRWDLSLLLTFIKNHPKWVEDSYSIQSNLGNRTNKYAGFYMNPSLTTLVEAQVPFVYHDTVCKPLHPVAEAALYEVLDYAAEENLKLLFVDTPKILAEAEMGRINQVHRILEEEDADYLSYYSTRRSLPFTIDLDFDADFYNDDHVNFSGAEKFTDSFSAYLDTHYHLPDRRADAHVQQNWDGIYSKILTSVEKYKTDITAPQP